jgi:hypothetical protein
MTEVDDSNHYKITMDMIGDYTVRKVAKIANMQLALSAAHAAVPIYAK